MTETRVVTGTILDPLGNPWKDFPIVFTLTPSTYTDDATLPTKAVRVYTDELGQFTTELITGVEYQVLYSSISRTSKDQTLYTIVVPSGNTPITLQELQVGSFTPNTPDILSLVDQKLVSVQTDIEDLDSRLDSLDADLGDTVSRINSSLKPDGTLKDTVVTRAALAADVAAALLKLPLVRTIADLGDSISTAGPTFSSSANQNFPVWRNRASAGRINWAGKYGEGGMGLFSPGAVTGKTWRQAVADLLAGPIKPELVSIMIGTNDIGRTETVPQRLAELEWGVNQILASGSMVMLNTVPPKSGLTASLKLQLYTFNMGLVQMAIRKGLPCFDMYSVVVDIDGTGNAKSGYLADGTHPGPVGAKAIGDAQWAYISSPTPPMHSLPMDNTALGSPYILDNPLFATDTNADGVPDLWTAAAKPDGMVIDLVTDAGVVGKAWHWKRNGEAGGVWARITNPVDASPGDMILLGLRYKVTAPTNTSPLNLDLTERNVDGITGTALTMANVFTNGTGLSASDIAWTTQWIAMPTFRAATTVAVGIDLWSQDASGTSSGEFWVGQVRLANLTKLGIA